MGFRFLNMLSAWQWALAAAVPVLIVLLYFLKLRRRPVEVPSTYLWFRMLEDLHVNALWQRLKSNLLLYLQLAAVFLIMLALLRPGIQSERPVGDRFILLIDNSAGMQAADVEASRLAEAKRQARAFIDSLDDDAVAMVVSFSDVARVEQPFTDNRRRLRAAVDGIEPTYRRTSIDEALRVAAGLANPGRSATDVTDFMVAEPLPATIVIFSDGKFDPPEDFRLGNLTPVFRVIGTETPVNIGITAFAVEPALDEPGTYEVLTRVRNFGNQDANVELELHLDGELIDAARTDVPAGKQAGVTFRATAESGVLEVRANTGDQYSVDDVAYAVIRPPRRVRVLLFTPGNEPLVTALSTPAIRRYVDLEVEFPQVLQDADAYAALQPDDADLVIYDRCTPPTMPQTNTWFWGALPPDGRWQADTRVDLPQVIDVDSRHPASSGLQLDDVLIVAATPLKPPPGGVVLVDGDHGPLIATAPRDAFEDCVVAFPLFEDTPEGTQPVTNWWLRPSFPVFVHAAVEYFGRASHRSGSQMWRTGDPVVLPLPPGVESVEVMLPDGTRRKAEVRHGSTLRFEETDLPGVYTVFSPGDDAELSRFAVNAIDEAESDIAVRKSLDIGYETVEGRSGVETRRREFWKWLLVACLIVLGVEWIVYGRRVSPV